MKFLSRLVVALFLLFALASLGLVLTGNQHLFKAVYTTYLMGEKGPHINDWKRFDTREVKSTNAQSWKISDSYNNTILSDKLRSTLEETQSIAFLVIKDDAIAYEEYWENYSSKTKTNSFSMAKSIVTMLAQVAIQEGHIKSWEDAVIDYIPELKGEYRTDLKLKHLSTMTAGLEWDEDYKHPFKITARVNYGKNIDEIIFNEAPANFPPGEEYHYVGAAVELLSMVISRSTGKTLSDFAQETLWAQMGAEETARWSLDQKDGLELAYCCFSSNARDFSRFGKLINHQGNWEGKQLLDSNFVKLATTPYLNDFYGYSFWIYESESGVKVSYMRGILGQYIISIPEKNLVICRLGHKRLPVENNHPGEVRIIIEEVLKQYGS